MAKKKKKPNPVETYKLDEYRTSTFGKSVKCLMKKKGLTQQALGELTGISQSFISKIINGGVRVNLVDAIKIAEALTGDEYDVVDMAIMPDRFER